MEFVQTLSSFAIPLNRAITGNVGKIIMYAMTLKEI
jgi:hypothetical protein